MPDGTLQTAISALQTGLSAIATLSGNSGEDGQQPTGLQGSASLTASVSLDPKKPFDLNVDAQFTAVFNFDAETIVNNAVNLLRKLADELGLDQLSGIAEFASKLDNVDAILKGDWQVGLDQVLAVARDLDKHIPTGGLSMLGGLGDRLLDLHKALTGPEAQQIFTWFEGVRVQLNDFQIYVQRVDDGEDPAKLLLELLGATLADVLAIFNVDPIRRALQFLDAAPFNLLPQQIITDFTAAKGPLLAGLPTMQAQIGNEESFIEAVIAHQEHIFLFQDQLRQLVNGMDRLANLEILQPGELVKRLGDLLGLADAVEVVDNRKIKDPFDKLFDTIDQAIGQFDFSKIRKEILDQFNTLRQILEKAKLDNVLPDLNKSLDTLDDAVRTARDGITDLQNTASQGIGDVRQRARDFLGPIGTFDAQGNFIYVFEADLLAVLENGKKLIEGDPNDPENQGLRGLLLSWQDKAKGFFQNLETQLTPVKNNVDQISGDAVKAINDFKKFIEDLNMPVVMKDLADQLDAILKKLTAVDFRQVTDPIVAELNENGEKLGKINADDLNDLLKAALSEALKVVIDIDLTATITDPLKGEMAKVKAVPAQAVEVLQRRFEEALALLDSLSPEQVLNTLFEAFNLIRDALKAIDLNVILQALDDLHKQYLADPFDELKPSVLLEPISNQMSVLMDLVDAVDAAKLLAPLQTQLDTLKGVVTNLDLTAPLDELAGLTEPIKQKLTALKPSDALQGLEDTFQQLEEALDKLKPSVIMAPAAQVAQRMTAFLETVQQDLTQKLFDLFQEPLALLERLNPDNLTKEITTKLDQILSLVKAADPVGIYQQLKAGHFDLRTSIKTNGLDVNLEFSAVANPEPHLGPLIEMYIEAEKKLTQLKQNLAMTSLQEVYDTLKKGVLELLPPYAKAALDPETFKRVMGLADPTRFLTELDARFDTLKNKILFIRPQDLAQEIDTAYQSVLTIVDSWTFGDLITGLKARIQAVKAMIDSLRVDFLAEDLNQSLADVRALLNGLNPVRFLNELDSLHGSLASIVDSVKPSILLADLVPLFQLVTGILDALDLEDKLKKPLVDAWKAVLEQLKEIDFRILLKPVSDRLDALEAELIASLRLVEGAFDNMLNKGRSALGSGGSSSVSLSVSAGGSI